MQCIVYWEPNVQVRGGAQPPSAGAEKGGRLAGTDLAGT